MSYLVMTVLAAAPGLLLQQLPAPAASPAPDTVVVRLADLAAIALSRESTLRARTLDTELARADVVDAESAFDPLLQLGGAASGSDVALLRTDGRFTQRVGGRTLTSDLGGAAPWSTRYTLSLESVLRSQVPLTTQAHSDEYDNVLTFALTQPVLRGFGGAAGRTQVHAASAGLRAARADLRRLAELTVADVERLYWTLARREEEESVAAQSLRRAETLLHRNVELRRLDKVTEADLTTARLGVAQRRNALVLATRDREDAADDLVAFAYGDQARAQYRGGDRVLRTVDQPVLAMPLAPATEAESLALGARGDVAAARWSLERYRELRALGRNGLLPALDLVASYSTLVNNAPSLRLGTSRPGDVSSGGWSMGVSASIPLANGGARANAMQRDALYSQQAIVLAGLESRVRTEVRQARRAVETGTRVLALADTTVELSERQYAMELQRLELGLSESFRLLQQEEQVANAQFAQVSARFDLAIAVSRLEVATGRDLLAKYGLDARWRH